MFITECVLSLLYNILTENLALRKPANQTGMWGGLSADRAVDGRYGTNGSQYYCAHPDNRVNGNKPAEWWVDLQDIYLVDNVIIYNTYDVSGKSYVKLWL